jgi:ppGpp synthetase/RelA/SpoT-type nucleotidyltranferase
MSTEQMSLDSEAPLLMSAYDSKISLYDDFRFAAEAVLRELVRLEGVRVHSITSRTKTRDSFSEKLGRDTKDGYEELCDVTDLIGIRVITHIEDEVDKIGDLIQREFVVDGANSVDKRQALDPDRFGYLSLHYVCSFDESRTRLAENRRFSGLKFEVQVRSILQHAWAEIEHDLGYKAGSVIPAAMRRRFSRLAGLLEIADNEFMRLRDELDTYAANVPNDIAREPSSVALDDVSLASFISTNQVLRELDLEMAAFVKRPLAEKTSSSLAAMLNYAGIETIEEMSLALDKYREVILLQWKERLASRDLKGSVGKGIGLFHLSQVLLVVEGGEAKLMEAFAHLGIGSGVFKNTVNPADAIQNALRATGYAE